MDDALDRLQEQLESFFSDTFYDRVILDAIATTPPVWQDLARLWRTLRDMCGIDNTQEVGDEAKQAIDKGIRALGFVIRHEQEWLSNDDVPKTDAEKKIGDDELPLYMNWKTNALEMQRELIEISKTLGQIHHYPGGWEL